MIEVGILKNFDSGTYKAGVQLAGSLTTYFDDISVAKNIPSSALVIGNYVIVAIPQGNPKDACVIATWPQGSPGGGAGSFLDLSDTPSSYSGQAGKLPEVNDAEDALEFTWINKINWISPKHFWTFGVHISSTPRTATISSVSGDVITLSASHAYRFFYASMTGNVYVKIANTSKSPVEYAWVKDIPAGNQLQVTNSSDISGWANGDTISTAKDGASSQFVELDLSPNTDIPDGATAIYARIYHTDSGTLAPYKGVDIWRPDMTGAFLVGYMQNTNATFTVFGFISIDSNKHVIARDRATGTDTLQPGAVVMGYLK